MFRRENLPLALAASVATLAMLVPLMIGLTSRPSPRATATSTPSASASDVAPTASPTATDATRPIPLLDERLTYPGDTATIPAVDASGEWGSIELTRGWVTGGYPHHTVDADVFVLEVFVEYKADRVPRLEESGPVDWALATAGTTDPIGRLISVRPPLVPEAWDPRLPLEIGYSTLVDVLTVPVRGMLYFEVPRSAEDRWLVLLYRPQSSPTPVIGMTVREPGPAPDPVPAATPVPTPLSVSYVSHPGLPFSVVDSPAADALFATPDECVNLVDGYRVTYPDSWYTNTQVGNPPANPQPGDSPPCSWFSPTYYELALGPPWPPGEIVIILDVFDGGFGPLGGEVYTVDEQVAVDGFAAIRREVIGACYPGPCRSEPPEYYYAVYIGDPVPRAFGLTMLARAPSERSADYELTKAVFDRIMASIEFLP
jgi:hypothetical protein